MVKQISKVEDVGDERELAFFCAAVNVFFNGYVEAAIKDYNETQIRYEAINLRHMIYQFFNLI
mgnify:CR=1 FL=1